MLDSHIHLTHRKYDQKFPYIDMVGDTFQIMTDGDRKELIEEMKKRGVDHVIEPAISVDSNETLLNLSRESDGYILPAVGNHPTRCIYSGIKDFKRVYRYSENKDVVAIGETGLDYHYARKDQHRIRQKIWFYWQIDLADRRGLPLILHIRQADKDAIRILRRNRRKLHGGVCHCFSGDEKAAGIYTDELGFCLGIGGAILKESKENVQLKEAVAATPLKYLLLETDGPFVLPEKPDEITGKKWQKARNTSLILPAVAKEIGRLKGLSTEEVLKVTEEYDKSFWNKIIIPKARNDERNGNRKRKSDNPAYRSVLYSKGRMIVAQRKEEFGDEEKTYDQSSSFRDCPDSSDDVNSGNEDGSREYRSICCCFRCGILCRS